MSYEYTKEELYEQQSLRFRPLSGGRTKDTLTGIVTGDQPYDTFREYEEVNPPVRDEYGRK